MTHIIIVGLCSYYYRIMQGFQAVATGFPVVSFERRLSSQFVLKSINRLVPQNNKRYTVA